MNPNRRNLNVGTACRAPTDVRCRCSIRLEGYNYATPGSYFVTLCTAHGKCVLGDVSDGEMRLNRLGVIVQALLLEIPSHSSNAGIDHFVVMPNHVHGIVILQNDRRGTACRAHITESFGKSQSGSLTTIIRSFKSATTRAINLAQSTQGYPFWQRGYYEHIIRNDEELTRIREYVDTNPLRWHLDHENPDASEFENKNPWEE